MDLSSSPRLILALLLWCSAVTFNCANAQYEMTRYQKSNGMMSNGVESVWQDQAGYIWVRGDEGLNRISGLEIKNFPDTVASEKNHLDSMYVNYINHRPSLSYVHEGDTVSTIIIGESYSSLRAFQAIKIRHNKSEGVMRFINVEGDSVSMEDSLFLPNNEIIIDLDKIRRQNPSYRVNMAEITGFPGGIRMPWAFAHQNKCYFLTSGNTVTIINSQLKYEVIEFEDVELIHSIVSNADGSYYLSSPYLPYVRHYSSTGKFIQEVNNIPPSQTDVQLWSEGSNTYAYYLISQSLYRLVDGRAKLVSSNMRRAMFGRTIDHRLFFVKKGINDEKAFYEIIDGKLNFIDFVDFGTIESMFVDRESNIWVTAIGYGHQLYKMTKSHYSLNYFLERNYDDKPQSSGMGNLLQDGTDVYHFFGYNDRSNEELKNKISGGYTHLYFQTSSGRRDTLVKENLEAVHQNDSIIVVKHIKLGDRIGPYSYSLDLAYSYLRKAKKGFEFNFFPKGLKFKDGYFYSEDTLFRVEGAGLKYLRTAPKGHKIIHIWNESNGTLFMRCAIEGTDSSVIWAASETHEDSYFPDSKIQSYYYVKGDSIVLIDKQQVFTLNRQGDTLDQFPVPDEYKFQSIDGVYISPIQGDKILYRTHLRKLGIIDIVNSSVVKLRFSYSGRPVYPSRFRVSEAYNKVFFQDDRNIYWSSVKDLVSNNNKNGIVPLELLISLPERPDPVSWGVGVEENDSAILVAYYGDVFSVNKKPVSVINTFVSKIRKLTVFNQEGRQVLVKKSPKSGLKLESDENTLVFDLEAMTNYYPETVYYKYRLIGSNNHNWVTVHSDSLSLSNLEPGQYTLEVQAFNAYKVSSEITTVEFTIKPPWHETLWFRLGALFVLVACIILVIRIRTGRLRKRQRILEKTVEERTEEVVEQKKEAEVQRDIAEESKKIVEEKNAEILDSINYAKRIQTAILPPQKVVKEYLQDSFILYKPKDIVAGDFYWLEHVNDKVLFAACDCTGHGVPGAMVSVICNNGLNRSVREYELQEPGSILDKTRELVLTEFEKSEEEVKDGMDVALCSLEGNSLKYAGANNPLWIVRSHAANGSSDGAKASEELEEIKAKFSANTKVEVMGDYLLIEVKADKQPVGRFDAPLPYVTHHIELNEGDTFYIFSDGFADQFGGERGKKYKTSNFKRLLISIQSEPMDRQKERIDEAFENWRGELEQLDDVCVIGVRHT